MAGDAFLGTGTGPYGTGLKSRTIPPRQANGLGTDSDRDLINRLRQLFQTARNRRQPLHERWVRNYKLVHNRQSAMSITSTPSPKDSEIYPVLSALVAWMTDQSPEIDISPAADPHSDYAGFMLNVANDLSIVMQSTWDTENYDAQVKLILWDAFQYGVGILKSVWDNSLSDNYGNATIRRVDPFLFYPDPTATSMSDAEYFIEARIMSFEEIQRRFPDTASKLDSSSEGRDAIDFRPTLTQAITPGSQSPMNTDNLGAVMGGQQRWAKSKYMQPNRQGTVVYEFWLRENEGWEEGDANDDNPDLSERHISDTWRVVVVANNTVLLDEYADELWSHAGHPYDRYVFDDIGEFYGIALVDHLAHPQIFINRLLSTLQSNADLTGNPILLEPSVGNTARVNLTSRPGLRVPIQGPGGMQNKPEWMQPPTMPPSVMELVQFWISRMENTSGLSAIVRGATPTQRNAEGVMSSIQEAAFVRIRSALRNEETTITSAMRKCADLIIDNYTEPRIMAITGPKTDDQTSLVLHSRHFSVPTESGSSPLKYTLRVNAGSSRPTSRQARIEEATKFAALGIVDDQYVAEAAEIPHMQEMLKRKYAKIKDGTFQPPGARQRAGRSK